MNWKLTGTDAQIAIIQNALNKIKFPFERLKLPGKPELGWRDLNTPKVLKFKDDGHEAHHDEHDELGEPHFIEGTLEGRYYVMGVFYPGNGSIYLDNKLVNYKDMAEATVSAEIAHAVDEFLPLTEEQRNAIILLLNDGKPSENTWWEKVDYTKEYFTLSGECVDEETMCLCLEKGWVNHTKLEIGDTILSFDAESDGLRWTKVNGVNVSKMPYRLWSNRNFSCAVTDNHNWLVRDSQRKLTISNGYSPGYSSHKNNLTEPREKTRATALDAIYKPTRLVKTTDLTSGLQLPLAARCLDQPAIPIYSDDFVEIMAWTLTEGYHKASAAKYPDRQVPMAGMPPSNGSVIITQKKYRAKVAKLMARNSIPKIAGDNEGCHQWRIGGDMAKAILDIAPLNRTPSIEFFSKLTRKQLLLFVETCLLGDGNESEEESRATRLSFIQNEGGQLDAFLTAAVLAGIPLHRNQVKTNHLGNKCETWTLKNSDSVDISSLVPSDYIEGTVWCPSTDLGTFVARRGDSVFLTGNSFMILFTKAYSEIPFGSTASFEDQGQNITGEQIRAIIGVERTDKPDVQKILAWKKRARALVQRLAEDMAEIEYLLKNKPK